MAKEVLSLKKRLFSLIICLFLFMSLFSGFLNFVYAPAGDGIVEIDVNPQGTFLRAVNWYPRWAPGPSDLTPTIVDLGANGLNPGDVVVISFQGNWSYNAGWERPETTTYAEAEKVHLLALFSASSSISAMTNLNRVAGAIDYGEDFVTANTWWEETLQKRNDDGTYDPPLKGGNQTTDIPEDFRITPYTGMEIKIPNNAKFLMFAHHTRYLPCARGNIKVILELDSDGDGIPDNWEINGIDYDKDGEIDLDLPMLGADWEHKDIFVECDWGGFGGINTGVYNQAVNRVVDSFAKAPVNNPDNVNGINLHIIDSEGVGTFPEVISWNDFINIKNAYFGNPDERAESAIIEAKKLVFHYCLFANKQVGNGSGRGEWPGNDFLITLGSSPEKDDLAATFMHELGHNLGLHHGGNEPLNYKPNYISVMNYMFQLDSYGTGRSLDFSVGNHNPLVESNLNENSGVGEAVKTVWRLTNGNVAISDGNLAIDWNADGNIAANVQMNLNNFPQEPNANDDETLRDYNDWGTLFYRFRGTSAFASGAQEDSHTELTLEEIEAMKEEAKNIIEVPIPESYNPDEEKRSIEIDLSSRGTFLRAEPFQGSPSGGSAVEDPAIVNLVEEGFEEGDSITISYSGQYHYRAFWDNGELAEIYTAEEIPLLGLFSTSEDLNPIDELNRVPGAIDYGEDIITDSTYFKQFQTDISEDFKIEPHTGAKMKIPEGAKYLFLCIYDGFYPDDVGDIKISIQQSQSSAFPFELIIILAIALGVVILLILLLNKRKKKKDKKQLQSKGVK